MIRTGLILSWIVLVTFFLGLIEILVSFFQKSGNLPHRIARFWGWLILLASRIRVQVSGHSNLDPTTPCIFMSNHQSNFDVPVLLAYLNAQFRWLAKTELFKIPIFGLAMRRAGYISIDRGDHESAIRSMAMAADAIRNGASVMIFPEGTRSRDGRIQPFKKGGFVLAVDSGAPIVPITIHGTGRIMSKTGMKINTGSVCMEIGKPIQTAGYTRDTKDALMAHVRRTICEQYEKGHKGPASC